MGKKLKRMYLFLLFTATITFSIITAIDTGQAETKYYYISDTERYYYKSIAYNYPYVSWHPYLYWINSTHYEYYYHPYTAIGHSYRRIRVYQFYLDAKSSTPRVPVEGSGWYDEGSSAYIYASESVEPDIGTKYLFDHWSGDYSGSSPSATLTMDRPKVTTAEYNVKYHLLAKSTPTEAMGYIEDNWYDEGATRIIQEAPEHINFDEGARYSFDSWYVNGKKLTDSLSITVTMNEPHDVEAKFITQYYMDVRSAYGDPQGSGWYNEGEYATISVDSPVNAGIGRKFVFQRWSGDIVSTSNEESTLMNRYKSADAVWRLDSTVLYIILCIIIAAVVLGSILYQTQYRYRQSCPKCGYRLGKYFKLCPECGRRTTSKPSKNSK